MPFFNSQDLRIADGSNDNGPVEPSGIQPFVIDFSGVAGVNDVGTEERIFLSEGSAAGNWWEGVFFRLNAEYLPTYPNIVMAYNNPNEDWFHVDAGTHDGVASVLNLTFDAIKNGSPATVWNLTAWRGTGFTPAQNQDVTGLTQFYSDTVVFSETAENKSYSIPLGAVPAGEQVFIRWEVDQVQSGRWGAVDNIAVEVN